MARLVALFLIGVVAVATAATVYRWVDEQGNVHYGDHPPPQGAEPVRLPEPPRRAAPGATAPDAGQDAMPSGSAYTRMAIAQPQDGATLRGEEGKVLVSVSMEPGLISGHYLHLSLDGRVVGGDQTRLLLELQDLTRGPHEIQVAVFDAEGVERGRSRVVRFYLLQSTPAEREAAERDYQAWLNELQQEREAALDAERRAQQERQLREQAEQKARVEERRASDFEQKTGDSPRFEAGDRGYPDIPTTKPGEPDSYSKDQPDLAPPTRPASAQRRGELQNYDPAELPKQDSGEPADYDPAKAPKSAPIVPHTGPGPNPVYAPTYTPPPANSGD